MPVSFMCRIACRVGRVGFISCIFKLYIFSKTSHLPCFQVETQLVLSEECWLLLQDLAQHCAGHRRGLPSQHRAGSFSHKQNFTFLNIRVDYSKCHYSKTLATRLLLILKSEKILSSPVPKQPRPITNLLKSTLKGTRAGTKIRERFQR